MQSPFSFNTRFRPTRGVCCEGREEIVRARDGGQEDENLYGFF